MLPRRIRRYLGILLLLISLPVLLWGVWPYEELSRSVPIRLADNLELESFSKRILNLEWPGIVRVGDADVIKISLVPDTEGMSTPSPKIAGIDLGGDSELSKNPDITSNMLVEARLDISSLQVTPRGVIIEPIQPGGTAIFYWSVRPDGVGDFSGTVWLHLIYASKEDGVEIRQPLTAQLIEIRTISLFGLGGAWARRLGGLGTTLGSFLSLDYLIPWLWKRTPGNTKSRKKYNNAYH